MQYNFPCWPVEEFQAGQGWNAAAQPNTNLVYWQSQSHPTGAMNLENSYSWPPGQSGQIPSHPYGGYNHTTSVTTGIRPFVQGEMTWPPLQQVPTFAEPVRPVSALIMMAGATLQQTTYALVVGPSSSATFPF